MNTYKDKYELLIENIEEITHEIKKLKETKEQKEKNYSKSTQLVSEKKLELMNLENQRAKIINKNDNLLYRITEFLVVVVGALALNGGINAYSLIAPIGIIKKIITVVGLTSLFGSLWLTVDLLIIASHNWLRRKFRNKNKGKKECVNLNKQIVSKSKDVELASEKQTSLLNEIEEIKNQIIEKEECFKTKINELDALRDEIINSVINPMVVKKENNLNTNEMKPHTRKKVKEN